MPDAVLLTVAACVVLGVAGQFLASLSRMPAIVFLLLLGTAAGPYGAGLVNPSSLGQGLEVLTSAFVAIILFEGGLSLRPSVLRQALGPVRPLISVGALITLGGAAVLAHGLMGLPWSGAILFGSLVMVTGPTVIAPILKRVRLQPRLAAVLKSESILIDPIGAIVAVVVLQYVIELMTHGASWNTALVGFFGRAGAGLLVGGLLAMLAALVLRLPIFHKLENEHLVSLGALGLALGAFALAECWYSESGIMATTVAGLVLAAAPLPFRDELEKFKEHLTRLGVSVLFILLAANVNLGLLREAGWQEALLLAGLIFLVRPASVFLSTWQSALGWREQAYLGLMAPRGIVAAAMASHFAQQLGPHEPRMASTIEGLVYLTIAGTVCLQGAWAGPLARLLRVRAERPRGLLLVGVNDWSLLLAEVFRDRGGVVRFLDRNPLGFERARERGFEVIQADATESDTYQEMDLSPIGTLLAMTPNDAVNTLACEAAAEWLGRKHVLQILAKPKGQTPRAKVRMTGRWALPTDLSYQTVATLLQQDRAALCSGHCRQLTSVSHRLATAYGPLIPLLVCDAAGNRLAVEGASVAAGGAILGIVERPAAPAAAA